MADKAAPAEMYWGNQRYVPAMTPDEQAVERPGLADLFPENDDLDRIYYRRIQDWRSWKKRPKDEEDEMAPVEMAFGDAWALGYRAAQPKVGDGEVREMVERLKQHGEGKLLGGFVNVPTGDFREMLALLERLTSPTKGGANG